MVYIKLLITNVVEPMYVYLNRNGASKKVVRQRQPLEYPCSNHQYQCLPFNRMNTEPSLTNIINIFFNM